MPRGDGHGDCVRACTVVDHDTFTLVEHRRDDNEVAGCGAYLDVRGSAVLLALMIR
jgi:hypothetical protein